MTEALLPVAARLHHDGGLVGGALARRLKTAQPAHGTGIRIVSADTPDALSTLLSGQDVGEEPCLLVVAELDRVVVGPLVRPGVPGCHRCLAARRAGARADAAEAAALEAAHGSRLTGMVSPLLTP
ncbi:TOMM precursor leader peptide-binding protein, partial [Streptomyces sp. SID625]|nr:TOMM precursor leader peptide-binding protein [Streptomyces sp. SID625]